MPRRSAHGLVRVVDESGEDYLYPRERFAPLTLPRGLQRPGDAVSQKRPKPQATESSALVYSSWSGVETFEGYGFQGGADHSFLWSRRA